MISRYLIVVFTVCLFVFCLFVLAFDKSVHIKGIFVSLVFFYVQGHLIPDSQISKSAKH